MKILFVTGSDSAFFNSLLIFLQSFLERLPGQQLSVCDFGMTDGQQRFLHSRGLLLPRPPALAARGVFACKASMVAYLRGGGHAPENYDAVVWLDADLMLMQTGFADFATVVSAMVRAGADIAICTAPEDRTIGQMIAIFPDGAKMAPFAHVVADAAIDLGSPYFSTGLIFCRSPAVLTRWMELTQAVPDHPLVEQNMFNVVLHGHRVAHIALSCEEWQAQGGSLDAIGLAPSEHSGRPAARIGGKNIKTLHTTSSAPGHLLIAVCRMTVRDLDLVGPFKLFLSEELRLHQLQLLATFVAAHAEILLRLGICSRAATPVEGFEFVTL